MGATRAARARVVAPAGAAALVPAGCETQEAEPLVKTVPTAVVLVAVTLGLVGWVCVWGLRQAHRVAGRPGPAPPLRFPGLLAGAALAPVVLATLVVTAAAGWAVAVGYRERTYQLLSWEASTLLFAVATVALVAVAALSAAGAVAASSRRTATRRFGRVVLAAPVLLFTWWALVETPGLALVALAWVPALLTSTLTKPYPPRPPVDEQPAV